MNQNFTTKSTVKVSNVARTYYSEQKASKKLKNSFQGILEKINIAFEVVNSTLFYWSLDPTKRVFTYQEAFKNPIVAVSNINIRGAETHVAVGTTQHIHFLAINKNRNDLNSPLLKHEHRLDIECEAIRHRKFLTHPSKSVFFFSQKSQPVLGSFRFCDPGYIIGQKQKQIVKKMINNSAYQQVSSKIMALFSSRKEVG